MMVQLDRFAWLEMISEAWRVYPNEACGLLLGQAGSGIILKFVPVENAAASSRVFELDGLGYMAAERLADSAGLDVVGVMHSHSHTAAYPSATDLAEAKKPLVPPSWHWLIVSLAAGVPETRVFSIEPTLPNFGEGAAGIAEEQLVLTP